MNVNIDKVALATFSYFNTGMKSSESKTKCFYHGFVLGLMVELGDRYVLNLEQRKWVWQV